MTIIYIPRLIESAEQAEALPDGAVAVIHGDDWHDAAVKIFGGTWQEASAENWVISDIEMVGWTALVPIEAEEEYAEEAVAEGEFTGIVRLVTPWDAV